MRGFLSTLSLRGVHETSAKSHSDCRRRGDVLVAQGNLPEALKSFRDGPAIADRLAKAGPGNAESLRDLSVSYERIGDVLVAQGNLPEALKLFRGGLAIADRLAKLDPRNAGWQRDLPLATGSPLPSVWPRPTPATPFGSATCRCRMQSSPVPI